MREILEVNIKDVLVFGKHINNYVAQSCASTFSRNIHEIPLISAYY